MIKTKIKIESRKKNKNMNKTRNEIIETLSICFGFLPHVFAVLVMKKSPEASLYWLKTAMFLSIVAPTLGYIIDQVWGKNQ